MNRALSCLLLALSAGITLGGASTAHAVCDQSGASAADTQLFNIHGCWQDFFLWHYQVYDTRAGDWDDRGYFDACNMNLEYPKHWNAAYLMAYGGQNNLAGSFHHGVLDYTELSRARETEQWHDDFVHQATDDTGIFGRYTGSTVQTSCALYSPGQPNANPGSRGGDFVHEATHAWMDHHGFDSSHLVNPAGGACTASGDNCDFFYFHGLGVYTFGQLHEEDGTASRFHSPNQSQVEYLCDIADFPQNWVPMVVLTTAATDANQRAVNRFINGPGFSCGDPRPW
jgi:hypothetical protein